MDELMIDETLPAARHERIRGIVAVAIGCVVLALAWPVSPKALPHARAVTSASSSLDPWAPFAAGWTELPHPPELRPGASIVWTGTDLIVWGGERPDGTAATDGFAFDPSSDEWRVVPPAPIHGRYAARAVWTGSEVLIWGGGYDSRHAFVDGAAYDTTANTWRPIPPAPLTPRFGGVGLWTGRSFIVWGGGNAGDPSNVEGAAYDPATNTWLLLPDAPLGLNAATAVWTGREMIVFGSLLEQGNRSRTRRAVGEVYQPATRSWTVITRSPLSPQASSGGWIDGRLVAWDYGARAARYDPRTDRWRRFRSMPIDASECYPDSAVFEGGLFAFFCGHAALFDGHNWSEARSRFAIPGPGGFEYTTGEAVGAGTAVVISEQELTTYHGEPCIGCSGAGQHLWVFRPGATAASLSFTRHEARDTARRFMRVRLYSYGPSPEMNSLLSRTGRRAFRSRSTGLHPLYGSRFRHFRILSVTRCEMGIAGGSAAGFGVGIRMSANDGRRAEETLLIGPGRSINGRDLDLYVNGGQGGVEPSTDPTCPALAADRG